MKYHEIPLNIMKPRKPHLKSHLNPIKYHENSWNPPKKKKKNIQNPISHIIFPFWIWSLNISASHGSYGPGFPGHIARIKQRSTRSGGSSPSQNLVEKKGALTPWRESYGKYHALVDMGH